MNLLFLAIMGPMKPVSDVLCTIYSSDVINYENQKRIKTLIHSIYYEITKATGIKIPNADELIILLLAICKGKKCDICETKLQQINDMITNDDINDIIPKNSTNAINDTVASAKITANLQITKVLELLEGLIGKADDANSIMTKLIAKYTALIKDTVTKLNKAVTNALTMEEINHCINLKITNEPGKECFQELKTVSTTIQSTLNDLKNDTEFKSFYNQIQKIQTVLSPTLVGGKTRRCRLMRSRRRGSSIRRRRHQHSRQQSKHKNKREQH